MKYAYYKEIYAKDLVNIPYLYWWRHSVLLRANNVWHDLVCIANGSISVKGALMALIAVSLSPLLLLLSPWFSWMDQKKLSEDVEDVYYENMELHYVPSKYIQHSKPHLWR